MLVQYSGRQTTIESLCVILIVSAQWGILKVGDASTGTSPDYEMVAAMCARPRKYVAAASPLCLKSLQW